MWDSHVFFRGCASNFWNSSFNYFFSHQCYIYQLTKLISTYPNITSLSLLLYKSPSLTYYSISVIVKTHFVHLLGSMILPLPPAQPVDRTDLQPSPGCSVMSPHQDTWYQLGLVGRVARGPNLLARIGRVRRIRRLSGCHFCCNVT